jgi:predicted NUDIX family NTP pyrophosphohydrolase
VFLVHPGGPFWARKDAGASTKVAEMEREISTLETQVSRLQRELDQLTTRRRASVVG